MSSICKSRAVLSDEEKVSEVSLAPGRYGPSVCKQSQTSLSPGVKAVGDQYLRWRWGRRNQYEEP